MKIRNGFVSNSSSSSFVVVADGRLEIPSYLEEDGIIDLTDSNYGAKEFGWEHHVYSDFESKLNFAFLQTTTVRDEQGAKWREMITRVLAEQGCNYVAFPEGKKLKYGDREYVDYYDFGYIDHQSSAGEGMNDEMFASEDALKQFLFCPGSYIETDNDNH